MTATASDRADTNRGAFFSGRSFEFYVILCMCGPVFACFLAGFSVLRFVGRRYTLKKTKDMFESGHAIPAQHTCINEINF